MLVDRKYCKRKKYNTYVWKLEGKSYFTLATLKNADDSSRVWVSVTLLVLFEIKAINKNVGIVCLRWFKHLLLVVYQAKPNNKRPWGEMLHQFFYNWLQDELEEITKSRGGEALTKSKGFCLSFINMNKKYRFFEAQLFLLASSNYK